MSNTRVLVFGKHGQVGSNLVKIMSTMQDIDLVALDIEDIDLTQIDEIDQQIQKYSADWVINGTAHTAVDRAESEIELSYLLNRDAPLAMARSCCNVGAKFLHYSTDYVFDGEKDSPYVETDSPNPKSVYGNSKLAGENAVLEVMPESIILRTSWVYSKQGKNFVNTMLNLAESKDTLSVVDDQYGSPTLADDLAATTVNIIMGVENKHYPQQGGVFHATGQGVTNWYEFSKSIFDLKQINIKVNPIKTIDFPTEAPRPAYSVLSNEKLKQKFNQELPDWKCSLVKCLN